MKSAYMFTVIGIYFLVFLVLDLLVSFVLELFELNVYVNLAITFVVMVIAGWITNYFVNVYKADRFLRHDSNATVCETKSIRELKKEKKQLQKELKRKKKEQRKQKRNEKQKTTSNKNDSIS